MMTAPRSRRSSRPLREAAREDARGTFRGAILSAAERVFEQSGFHEAKMTDIAREAGVGVGTLYNYFESKEVIFGEIVDAQHAAFVLAVEAAEAQKGPIEALAAIIEAALRHVDERGAFLAGLFEHHRLGEAELERLAGAKASRGYAHFTAKLESQVRLAVSRGLFRSDLGVELMVSTLSGAVNGVTYAWLKQRNAAPLAHSAPAVVSLFLEGARAR